MDHEALELLHRARFAELPADCGVTVDPGVIEIEQWHDWSTHRTTTDQLRIEAWLDTPALRGSRILHVGVGNSGLAERFSPYAATIVGHTISQLEVDRGRSLGLPNYDVHLRNKFIRSGDGVSADAPGPGGFDYIVDNNPTTFCCCMKHLAAMMEDYAANLAPRGQIVTDRVGLGWSLDHLGSSPRWGFSFEDFAAVGALVGLGAWQIDDTIIVLSRVAPPPATLLARLRNKAWRIRGRLVRKLRRRTAALG
ncbi:hypothetical protein [Novosphingobium lentum]|uniref:hypothetical protein n=1 Tax=Novosphingobium lentum TaxID=145287 RepID=UPI00082D3287|nr:hypothetical protein [Novosphingobium lentum]